MNENNHYNLFYIFKKDQQEHPIPPTFLAHLQEMVNRYLTLTKKHIEKEESV